MMSLFCFKQVHALWICTGPRDSLILIPETSRAASYRARRDSAGAPGAGRNPVPTRNTITECLS